MMWLVIAILGVVTLGLMEPVRRYIHLIRDVNAARVKVHSKASPDSDLVLQAKIFDGLLAAELSNLWLWRLLPGVITIGLVVFELAVTNDVHADALGFSWLGLAGACALGVLLLKRARDLQGVLEAGLLLGGIGCLWWLILPLFSVGSVGEQALTLGLTLGLVLPLPWFGMWQQLWVFALVAVSTQALSGGEIGLLLAFFPVLLLLLRASWIAQLSLKGRCLGSLIGDAAGRGAGSDTVIRLLAGLGAQCLNLPAGLIAFGDGRGELISIAGGPLPLHQREALRSLALRSASEGGEFFRFIPEPALEGAFRDWFGFMPQVCLGASFSGAFKLGGDRALVVLPISGVALLTGPVTARLALTGAVATTRVALQVGQSRVASSDVLVQLEDRLANTEYELGRLIHQVNNVAHEITISCDAMRERWGRLILKDHSNDFNQDLETVLMSARFLAAGVSDLKVLTELEKLRAYPHKDFVDVTSLLEEIGAFARYRANRTGQKALLAFGNSTDMRVEVMSREFLEAVLRLLVRAGLPAGQLKGEFRLSADIGEGKLELGFHYPEGLDLRAMDIRRGAEVKVFTSVILEAAEKVARLSGGECLSDFYRDGALRSIRMRLRVSAIWEAPKRAVGSWALLVDDKPEITIFYGRIAEALNVPYVIANSLTAALKVLNERGRPHLVITDLDLGDGNGLSLVNKLQADGGTPVRIIIVSGSANESVLSEIKDRAHVRYVTKPVGRRKLFAEIQSILGR